MALGTGKSLITIKRIGDTVMMDAANLIKQLCWCQWQRHSSINLSRPSAPPVQFLIRWVFFLICPADSLCLVYLCTILFLVLKEVSCILRNYLVFWKIAIKLSLMAFLNVVMFFVLWFLFVKLNQVFLINLK